MWNKSKQKYGNQKSSSSDGRSFSSKAERALYEKLMVDVLDGRLSDLQCQDHVALIDGDRNVKITYIPDFKAYDCVAKEYVWIEFKGFKDAKWSYKKRLWRAFGPGRLQIYKGSEKHVSMVEELPAGIYEVVLKK